MTCPRATRSCPKRSRTSTPPSSCAARRPSRALHADAVRTGHDGFWLHVPVGKLHDDRYVLLNPTLVGLIRNYRRQHITDNNQMLIPYENGRPLRPAAVARMLDNITSAAGMPHVHPHKLRHTLATQAINRGMSMEAIAALLGHHSLDMTRSYARLHDKTLATAYDVADKSTRSTAPRIRTPRRHRCTRRCVHGCSATATAPGRGNSTASSTRSAKPASTSRPASPSGPSYKPNTTTPPARTRQAASRSSSSSSTTSTDKRCPKPLTGSSQPDSHPSPRATAGALA